MNVVNTFSLFTEGGLWTPQCIFLCLYLINEHESHCTIICKDDWWYFKKGDKVVSSSSPAVSVLLCCFNDLLGVSFQILKPKEPK